MVHEGMVVVTGARGFIGSALCATAPRDSQLVQVDRTAGMANPYPASGRTTYLESTDLCEFLATHSKEIHCVLHMGATTDTTAKDSEALTENNFGFSKKLFESCSEHSIPLFYASSGSVYGDGSKGFSDSSEANSQFKPLNPYGRSKHLFDAWALQQSKQPPFWAGFRFFNVYGPNEYHKGDQASAALRFFRQLKKTGKLRLFKSALASVKDGHQRRDFIYIKDVCNIIWHFVENSDRTERGIYNVGTGKAEPFIALAGHVLETMQLDTDCIEWIPTPDDVKTHYQYYTCADVTKLRTVGRYEQPFFSLQQGVEDYLKDYLIPGELPL